ncbi:MAG: DUF2116 family Zn-ribbon domain-containing protein [Candidatus Methanoplasma sp.]|jgi:predicted nucleic acid-binding Zn ribbon protein|nr:DUF2116 family Zn-ribbon domain-containing protein [Candidatus Methanoplasma sp.]
MAVLPEHDHCKFCGDAVPFDQAYCSEKCYWEDQAGLRAKKKNNVLFAVFTVASVAVTAAVGVMLR